MKVMIILGVVIIIIGIYMVFAGSSMKKKGDIGNVILTEEEGRKCHNKEGFINYIYWREIIVGVAVVLLGIAEILNNMAEKAEILSYIGIIVGILALLWFFYSLKRARELFVKA